MKEKNKSNSYVFKAYPYAYEYFEAVDFLNLKSNNFDDSIKYFNDDSKMLYITNAQKEKMIKSKKTKLFDKIAERFNEKMCKVLNEDGTFSFFYNNGKVVPDKFYGIENGARLVKQFEKKSLAQFNKETAIEQDSGVFSNVYNFVTDDNIMIIDQNKVKTINDVLELIKENPKYLHQIHTRFFTKANVDKFDKFIGSYYNNLAPLNRESNFCLEEQQKLKQMMLTKQILRDNIEKEKANQRENEKMNYVMNSKISEKKKIVAEVKPSVIEMQNYIYKMFPEWDTMNLDWITGYKRILKTKTYNKETQQYELLNYDVCVKMLSDWQKQIDELESMNSILNENINENAKFLERKHFKYLNLTNEKAYSDKKSYAEHKKYIAYACEEVNDMYYETLELFVKLTTVLTCDLRNEILEYVADGENLQMKTTAPYTAVVYDRDITKFNLKGIEFVEEPKFINNMTINDVLKNIFNKESTGKNKCNRFFAENLKLYHEKVDSERKHERELALYEKNKKRITKERIAREEEKYNKKLIRQINDSIFAAAAKKAESEANEYDENQSSEDEQQQEYEIDVLPVEEENKQSTDNLNQ